MGGIIKFNNDTSWMVASWAYDSVLFKAKRHIPSSLGHLATKIEAVTGDRLHFLDMEGLSEGEVKVLFAALNKAYEDTKNAGANSFADPTFFNNYLDRFEELILIFRKTYPYLTAVFP